MKTLENPEESIAWLMAGGVPARSRTKRTAGRDSCARERVRPAGRGARLQKDRGPPQIVSLNAGVFSLATDEWETPPEVFDPLNALFRFTLDPCATVENAKCRRYFTRAEDGLAQLWAPERVFMNPPFGRRQIGDWVRKAYEEAGRGALCVCLLPASTDTAWWHDYVEAARLIGDVGFLRGRVRFRRPSGTYSSGATFPSAVVIFRPQRKVTTLSVIHRRLERLARHGLLE